MSGEVKLVGLSGPSSSGKSTLGRLLLGILPNVSIIYQDDFYLEDDKIPKAANGLDDWDCPEAFDFEAMYKVLETTRRTGKIPEHHSKEHENKIGPKGVSDEHILALRKIIGNSLDSMHIVLVDGLMLYHENSPVLKLLDVKLFITAPYQVLKDRRESRAGYATIEGFWVDPPGYFDDIVWPGYKKTHEYLFADRDLEGVFDLQVVEKIGISSPSNAPVVLSVQQLLDWSISCLTK